MGVRLRGLIAPLLSVSVSPADWLPCHCRHLLASLSLPPRLRFPDADGFKTLLVLLLVSLALAEVRFIASSSMAPTIRPADRAVAEKTTTS